VLEQVGNSVTFYAFYVASKVGKTGLTVTVDVWEVTTGGTATEVAAGASATEIGDGLYRYILAGGTVDAEGEYLAVFKTSDATVDQQHIPALWVAGRLAAKIPTALVGGRMDSSVGAMAANVMTAAALATDAVTEIAAGVWDRLTSALTVVGSIGKLIVDRLDAAISSRAGSGTSVSVTSPVAVNGNITLKMGDDYSATDSRAVDIAYSGPTDITGLVPTLKIYGTGADPIVLTGSVVGAASPWTIRFQPTAAQTGAATITAGTYRHDVEFTIGGRKVTLVEGHTTFKVD